MDQCVVDAKTRGEARIESRPRVLDPEQSKGSVIVDRVTARGKPGDNGIRGKEVAR
jgi:hypothetical protein